MSRFVSEEAREDLNELLHLAQIRAFATADRGDKLALVTLLLLGAEVWMRNSSYPEMVEATNRELLDEDPNVRAALNAELGFDATDAITVLQACHGLQEDGMNNRMDAMRSAVLSAMAATQAGQPNGELIDLAGSSLMSMFEPGADEVTVTVEDIAAHTGISGERVEAVVGRFRLDLGSATPAEVVDAFMTGRNPMRTRPLVQAESGRLMLPHSALNVFAVRENLEDHLKTEPLRV